MADTTQVSQNAVAAAGHAYDAAYKLINDKANDARLATEKAAQTAAAHLQGGGITGTVIGTALSVVADALAVIMAKITEIKQKAQPGVHDLIVSTLSDALLIEIDPSDIPNAVNAAGQYRVNAALGGKFLDSLKQQMGANSTVTGDTAEQAVKSFIGFGMQLAVNTGFLALIGGAVPFEHFDEIKEIGEMLEKSLGLGRLMRQFLGPYLQQLVQKPLTRKLAAQYRQDILGTGELARLQFFPGEFAATARTLLTQHGLSDDQIDALTNLHRPHLSIGELDALVFNGDIDQAAATAHIADAGVPKQISDLQFAAVTASRLRSLREKGINEVVSEIRKGFLDISALEAAFVTFNIPLLEQDLWRKIAAITVQAPHKRFSQADMLFLYEAAQITLDDVAAWARDEGFSAVDQQRIQTFFLLKAAASGSSKTGGAGLRAAHLHAEHIAFVTDEITGMFGRPPSTAELGFWVTLLDTAQRTKADFKTELKALPTTGPAIPPNPPA